MHIHVFQGNGEEWREAEFGGSGQIHLTYTHISDVSEFPSSMAGKYAGYVSDSRTPRTGLHASNSSALV